MALRAIRRALGRGRRASRTSGTPSSGTSSPGQSGVSRQATDEDMARAMDSETQFASSDDTRQSISEENVAGNNATQHPTYQDQPYHRRLGADVGGRLAEQPSRAASGIGSGLAGAAKYGGGAAVAGTGLWAADRWHDRRSARQMSESRERTYEEYVQQAEEIRNDDSLTPEEKEEMLAQLREAYQEAIENPENSEDGGILGNTLGDLFGDMGMVEKVIVAMILVVLIKSAAEVQSSKGVSSSGS